LIITVAANKGGVGKTTTAFHLAAYLHQKAPTLLVDGDPNRSSLNWASRGEVPFTVVDERKAAKYARDPQYQHLVIDTEAHPGDEDLRALAEGCDLLIIPTTVGGLSLEAMLGTVHRLQTIPGVAYKILLTMVPPRPSRDGEEAKLALQKANMPVFETMIPRLVAFERAGTAGVPVYNFDDPRSDVGWDAYCRLGQEIGL
jgi:chromosome partitioning protein